VLHEAREDFPPHVARSAELLRAELDRFEGLLTDLLEISRYDAGAAVLDAEATDLGALIGRVVDGMEPLAELHDCELVVAAPEEAVIAEVDSRRVGRVLRNLVGNAIEHGTGKPVEVTLACNRTAAAITVRDYGVGLSSADAQHVFDRFWRADPARVRTVGGSGLGLSISLEDARLHGGWLQVWGQPGHGAQFRLTLPLIAGGDLSGSPLPLRPAVVRRHGLLPYGLPGSTPGTEVADDDDPDAVDQAELDAVDDEGLVDLDDDIDQDLDDDERLEERAERSRR
jgi:two-component system, OmpR family, sensor histidine kinase MtrB